MSSMFKTFTAGVPLTASEVNSYLMKQVSIVCDSSADYPSSPVEGMRVIDKELQAELTWSGSGWVRTGAYGSDAVQTYTPVLTQGSTVSATASGQYVRRGPIVDVWGSVDVIGSGTSSNVVTVSLPVASTQAQFMTIGEGSIFDASLARRYTSNVMLESASAVSFGNDDTAGGRFGNGGSITQALSASDSIRFHVTYLA